MMKQLLEKIVVLSILFFLSQANADLQTKPMTFVGVALDPETQEADERLRQHFQSRMRLKFENRDMEYSAAIQTLKKWNAAAHGPVMARITPYVYVVAEMLGAQLEILATYRSKKTGANIYHSYLVVRRADFSGNDLDAFVQYLRSRGRPARFVYHNKFSTSSFFLPSLYFREKDIFSVLSQDGNDRNYITIHAERPQNVRGSSDLVRLVASGKADFAAVWDGTKAKFDQDPELVFLKLPTPLPNDLLVVSQSLETNVKEQLHQAIDDLEPDAVNVGDFLTWINFNKTAQARRALAKLRWKARTEPKPVPIQVRNGVQQGKPVDVRDLEAARQAIRLAGTEFVVFDEDFHERFDVLWTLRKTHENALDITSEFVDSGLPPKVFHVSYKTADRESLVYRIGSVITSKMDRIRYLWLFDTNHPRVIRDVDFDIPQGAMIKGQKIIWQDVSNNDSIIGNPFDVEVAQTDFNTFELTERGFPKLAGGNLFDFDPMSNVAYRIYLLRPEQNPLLIKLLSSTLIVLFGLGAIFALISIARKPKTDSAV